MVNENDEWKFFLKMKYKSDYVLLNYTPSF